jgi:Na+-transporting methylmalonyl-CoA/oxaloacetate decarboxylase gamma subunit
MTVLITFLLLFIWAVSQEIKRNEDRERKRRDADGMRERKKEKIAAERAAALDAVTHRRFHKFWDV